MNNNPKLKAFILSAGMGSRMRPITELIPKPLIPFFEKPLIEYAFDALESAGIRDISCNSHHLANQLHKHLELTHPSSHLSFERELLDTGGGIANIIDWVGAADLLVFNADIICNLDLNKLISYHQRNNHKVWATLALLDKPDLSKTPIGICPEGFIDSIGSIRPHCMHKSFSGIHILSNRLLKNLTPKPHSITSVYKHLIERGERLSGFLFDDFWSDLGTAEDFYKAHSQFIKTKQGREQLKHAKIVEFIKDGARCFHGHKVRVPPEISLKGCNFLYGSTKINPNQLIEDSILIDAIPDKAAKLTQIIQYRHLTIQRDID
jgi:NDP-sugar pyrophosphorylase family protein